MNKKFVMRIAAAAILVVVGSAQAASIRYSVDTPRRVGDLDVYDKFPSTYVEPRDVQVWLPPSYGSSNARYPVLYMHDGQMLWDASTTWNHQAWDVDDVMRDLIAKRRIREAIVVGINNTRTRFQDYMPRKAITGQSIQGLPDTPAIPVSQIQSDDYLRFIVRELKPYIDSHYRTRADRANTLMAGSSMGGLISLYAIAEYPKVFGGVAAMSTHWPVGDGAMIDYLSAHLPSPSQHRLYFDHGTATLDAAYAPFQLRMDTVLRKAGYRCGRNWLSRVYPGDSHTETAWKSRLHVPLEFLLGTSQSTVARAATCD